MAKQAVKNQRGLFLGILLFMFLVFNIINLILTFLPFTITNYDFGFPLWVEILNPFLALAATISLVALYYWRKWGCYLLLVIIVINTIINVIIGSTIFDLVLPYIGLGVLYWAIYRKRELFR